MSTSDPTRPSVLLTAIADVGTDIFIIDSAFQLVARGVSRLSQPVAPGIYKVKFRTGSAIAEKLAVVDPATGPVEVRCPSLAFSSSIPLAGTRKTHEYHMDSAATLSREVHQRIGHGAQIFVFARAWTEPAGSYAPGARPPARHNPVTGLTLHALDGRVLVTFEKLGRVDLAAPDPWAGSNLEVDPGAYRLRLHVPGLGDLEQLVFAPADWQTQIFLLQHDYGDGSAPTFRADLANASILLARVGMGFVPDEEAFRLAELARLGLQNRRTTVPRDLLERMLDSKFDNPMLGIYGAHALLAGEAPDLSLLRIVLGNLGALVPAHPDVEAVALYLGQSAVTAEFATPTMLRNSWSIVVDKATERPELVPARSLASGASTCMWGDSAWMIWLADRLPDAGLQAEPLHLLSDRIAQIAVMGTALSPETARSLERGATLDDFETTLLSYIVRRRQSSPPAASVPVPSSVPAEPPGPAGPGASAGPAASGDDDPVRMVQQMAKVLGVPPSTVQGTVDTLLSKLQSTIPFRKA